jgi:ABC-type Fe3+/spermidine/putrescine transport system ATPase subunit
MALGLGAGHQSRVSMSSVTLEKLVKRYGQTEVVKGIDLAIAEGELVVLLGPSGCGKTTTLRMIAGFVEPAEGTIRIGSEIMNGRPPRQRNLGMVFQDYALFPNMTVADNIGFGLVERKQPAATVTSRVAEMLRLTQMEVLRERYPAELSGGQQQRVALARALAYEPRVLLMDEPLGALDQKLREDMQREFARIQRRLGITTIFVTHDQQEAMALADRIVVMNAGRIEQVGRPRELYEDPRSLFIADFIGRSNRLPGVVEACDSTATKVRLAGDGVVVGGPDASLRPGMAVACIVRPERLRLAAAAPAGANALPVRIIGRSFLGASTDIVVETAAGTELVVAIPPGTPSEFADGPLTASFAPADLRCFAEGSA